VLAGIWKQEEGVKQAPSLCLRGIGHSGSKRKRLSSREFRNVKRPEVRFRRSIGELFGVLRTFETEILVK